MAFVVDVTGWLGNVIFPPHCVVCGRGGAWLCAECQETFAPISRPLCERCGHPITCGTLCSRCQVQPLAIDSIRSVYRFEGALRDSLHEFKYDGVKVLAKPFGRMMGDYLDANPVPSDVVIPVPLHKRRLRTRGYNQSALLAREIALSVGLLWDTKALVRQRETAPQVSLSKLQRRTNVDGAFVCIDESLRQRRVLLVDDVCTTGATLEACATALYEVGVGAVHGLTLARAIAV